MRYHKATKVNRPEADFIIKTSVSSLNDHVVMSYFDNWYDVRALTEKELDEFVADLVRADVANFEGQMPQRH